MGIKKEDKGGNGYEKAIYQGVISEKDTIKENFHDLRRAIERGKQPFIQEEWQRMKKLLDTIVFAFISNN